MKRGPVSTLVKKSIEYMEMDFCGWLRTSRLVPTNNIPPPNAVDGYNYWSGQPGRDWGRSVSGNPVRQRSPEGPGEGPPDEPMLPPPPPPEGWGPGRRHVQAWRFRERVGAWEGEGVPATRGPAAKGGTMGKLGGIAGVLLLVLGESCVARAAQNKEVSFQPAEALRVNEPEYPIGSAANGVVVLKVGVSQLGEIDRVDVAHGVPSLTEEAERAVRSWKFRPARLDGRPVRSSITASFDFALFAVLSAVPTWADGSSRVGPSPFEPVVVLSTVGAIPPFNSVALQIGPRREVSLRITVSKSGGIERMDVIHGIPSLTEQAERAVRKWKFQPAELGGKPIASPFIACFTFGIPGSRR